MTKEELAAKLNGREYGQEITKEEKLLAAQHGLVVMFGASDDLCELVGAIDDELGCYQGGTIYLDSEGLYQPECDDDDCPHEERYRKKHYEIEAVWCGDKIGSSWSYQTAIPHATFDIMEDGELYCRGIVFSLKDLGRVRR